MNKRYTIKDIAKLSGFSFKTVSRVINNEPNVNPRTKEKILKVIEETNFKPNLFAKNLHSKTVKTILISLRKTYGQNTTQWFDVLMSHMFQDAGSRDYTIIQEVIYDDNDLENSIMAQSSGFIDVVVLFYLQENDKRIEVAQRNHIPYIAFEKKNQVSVSISNNNRQGILQAAEFLFERKLTRICFLLGAEIEVNFEREGAMKEAYARHQIPQDHLETVFHMNNLEKIRQFVSTRIAENRLPHVFFVSGDEKAIAIYNAVYSHGLSIPQDVSVFGFDNIPISQFYSPPLTTMGQDFERLSKELFGIIDKILTNDPNVSSIQVEPRLIVRESVRALSD